MSDQYEPAVLDFDPFEGDFGMPGDKVFLNKLVTGRKQHQCSHCDGLIIIGEQHRYQSSKFDGEFMVHRWCAACCQAMVTVLQAYNRSNDDLDDDEANKLFTDQDAWESRSSLRTGKAMGETS